MNLNELGERYKNLRLSIEEKDPVSIKKLSELIGILPPRISELENGKRDMSLTELKAYHKYFKVSFEYLLGETDISSTNEDIKISCKVTGLSEEAVKKLQIIHENEDMYTPSRIDCVSSESIPSTGFFVFDAPSAIKIASELIEHRFFEILIGDIQIYSVMHSERNNTVNVSEELYNNIKNNPISSTYNYYITPNIIAETKLNHASDCIKRIITEITKTKEASDNAEHNPTQE
jgi:transcriptional regulator, XRE family